ncbi:polyprenyl synthetase family protein [Patescibacteria group bacterium]|nr:polyprenyl synthetase family protein [Patescibacteria group bacterium]
MQEPLTPSVEQQLLKASMSIEVVHTGLLVHDDFQDQDTVRR